MNRETQEIRLSKLHNCCIYQGKITASPVDVIAK